MLEYSYIPCYDGPAEHWGLLPASRLASREILIEQNIKKRTGPALCVLCGFDQRRRHAVFTVLLNICLLLLISDQRTDGTVYSVHSSVEELSLVSNKLCSNKTIFHTCVSLKFKSTLQEWICVDLILYYGTLKYLYWSSVPQKVQKIAPLSFYGVVPFLPSSV
jgi:hypothetical protein